MYAARAWRLGNWRLGGVFRLVLRVRGRLCVESVQASAPGGHQSCIEMLGQVDWHSVVLAPDIHGDI